MITTRKKLKRYYDVGGSADFPYGAVGNLAGEGLTAATQSQGDAKYNVNNSTFGTIGSGALKGAGQGALIGSAVPVIGTAVGAVAGAVIGGASSYFKNEKNKKLQASANAVRDRGLNSMGASRYIGYDTQGNDNHPIYAEFGGEVPKNVYLDGGELKPMSRDSVEIQGASHEDGGVQLGPDTEVEGNETMNNNFVFSDSLPANAKMKSFADVHKSMAKSIGRLEKKYKSPVVNNTIDLLNRKEDALKLQQETLKQMLGIKPIMK